jgi:hypothetical protein
VGSVACATGWFAVCAAYLWMKPPGMKPPGLKPLGMTPPGIRPRTADRLIALMGALVGLAMILMKFAPFVPGHFSGWEWFVLGLWIVLGTSVGRPRSGQLPTGSAP